MSKIKVLLHIFLSSKSVYIISVHFFSFPTKISEETLQETIACLASGTIYYTFAYEDDVLELALEISRTS